jgi:hypothetical protein
MLTSSLLIGCSKAELTIEVRTLAYRASAVRDRCSVNLLLTLRLCTDVALSSVKLFTRFRRF